MGTEYISTQQMQLRKGGVDLWETVSIAPGEIENKIHLGKTLGYRMIQNMNPNAISWEIVRFSSVSCVSCYSRVPQLLPCVSLVP